MKNKSSDNQAVETIFKLLDDTSSIDTLLDSFPELFNENFFALLRKLIQDAREKDDIRSAMRFSILAQIIRLSMEVKGIAPQDESWWKELEVKMEPTISAIGNRVTAPPLRNNPLREWWHELIRRYGHYPTYAMLLALPADEESIRYQKEFGKELHLITGEHCLVITLTGLGFMQYGSDDEIMPLAVDESTSNGYCLRVADLFNIQFSQFPCLILFRDIRSPDHILISLKGLSKEDVAQEMRELFSVVKQAIKEGRDPLNAVESQSRKQEFANKTKATWSSIQTFAGKTLEKVMQALIEASVK